MTHQTQTFADELRNMLPQHVAQQSSTSPDEAPSPLNQEALEVILQYARDKAQQGFGTVMFFLDGFFEQYSNLEHPTQYYVESVVLEMLRNPKLGFEVEEEDTGDGTLVKLRWSDNHPEFTYGHVKTIEVTPPEEYMPYLMSIKCGTSSWEQEIYQSRGRVVDYQ